MISYDNCSMMVSPGVNTVYDIIWQWFHDGVPWSEYSVWYHMTMVPWWCPLEWIQCMISYDNGSMMVSPGVNTVYDIIWWWFHDGVPWREHMIQCMMSYQDAFMMQGKTNFHRLILSHDNNKWATMFYMDFLIKDLNFFLSHKFNYVLSSERSKI